MGIGQKNGQKYKKSKINGMKYTEICSEFVLKTRTRSFSAYAKKCFNVGQKMTHEYENSKRIGMKYMEICSLVRICFGNK